MSRALTYRFPHWLDSAVPAVDWGNAENAGAKIEVFTVSEQEARMNNLRQAINGRDRYIVPGEYRRLYTLSGDYWTLQMSDTPAERMDHADFVAMAEGKVLVTGLGLGVVVNALLFSAAVRYVVVQEINQHVIDLVLPLLYSIHGTDRLVVRCVDAMAYKPAKGERFDWIWHDIWPNISTGNKASYRALMMKWSRRVPAGHQMAWAKELVYR